MDPREAAAAAQERAGVTVSVAAFADLPELIALFERTWGVGRSPDDGMLHAVGHAGNTVLIARDGEGRLVGGALGFLGWDGGLHLHSHMAAVAPEHRAGGVGFALKLAQRAICLEHGVTEMRWTFDPLIRRNAYFNLVKLGAEFAAFHPDFYGELDDLVSGGDRSDRAEVRWRMDSPRVERALAGVAPPTWTPGVVAERVPLGAGAGAGADAEIVSGLELPADLEAQRAADVASVVGLRDASRLAFPAALARGLRPELDLRRNYVFTADDPDREAGAARGDVGGRP